MTFVLYIIDPFGKGTVRLATEGDEYVCWKPSERFWMIPA